MFVFVCIVLILAGILLIAAVLIQPSKGQGLTAGMGGISGQISGMFGARRTIDFLQKFTIGLAVTIFVLAILVNKFFLPTSTIGSEGERTPITTGAPKPVLPPTQQQAPSPSQAPPQQ
ncbi:MAG: preprotein translocase subunit SecG [Bacteroidota bacterium]|nr:preprotein translocase subunit SecG [Candidatus Kapabacteria bacterium]MDW8220629.1 preprotein translocase subunit SecG [Bacteroidota bacterium]